MYILPDNNDATSCFLRSRKQHVCPLFCVLPFHLGRVAACLDQSFQFQWKHIIGFPVPFLPVSAFLLSFVSIHPRRDKCKEGGKRNVFRFHKTSGLLWHEASLWPCPLCPGDTCAWPQDWGVDPYWVGIHPHCQERETQIKICASRLWLLPRKSFSTLKERSFPQTKIKIKLGQDWLLLKISKSNWDLSDGQTTSSQYL